MLKKLSNIHRQNTPYCNRYQLLHIKYTFMKTGLHFRIPNTYNNMPSFITSKIHTHSLYGSKKYLKRSFINLYDSVCHVPNCYIQDNFLDYPLLFTVLNVFLIFFLGVLSCSLWDSYLPLFKVISFFS